jgi:hypothetical protein
MSCEFFSDGRYPVCRAVQGLMTPSLAQIRSSCGTDGPLRCQIFEHYQATNEKVPLEAAQADLAAVPPR